jgi:hypothetical protein
MEPTPTDARPEDCTEVHFEMVGEGFDDALGNPTVDGMWYLLGDHEASGTYGLILSGPVTVVPIPMLVGTPEFQRLPERLRVYFAAVLQRLDEEGRAEAGAHHGETVAA